MVRRTLETGDAGGSREEKSLGVVLHTYPGRS
jgi:hypothetical protein